MSRRYSGTRRRSSEPSSANRAFWVRADTGKSQLFPAWCGFGERQVLEFRPRGSGRSSSHSAAGGSGGAADRLLGCTLLQGVHNLEILPDQSVTLLDARVAPQRILRRVQHVVEKPGDRAGGHVQSGVRGAIVNEDLTILARHPTITEHHVGTSPIRSSPCGARK